MIVTSNGIVNGVILDRYGKRGEQQNEHGIPTLSLPLQIKDAPEDTVSFAIVLEDKDSYPVTKGFVWIHWLAANLTRTELKENESRTATDFLQGMNSWASIQGGSRPEKFRLKAGLFPKRIVSCHGRTYSGNIHIKGDIS